jgi:hypothetical protein
VISHICFPDNIIIPKSLGTSRAQHLPSHSSLQLTHSTFTHAVRLCVWFSFFIWQPTSHSLLLNSPSVWALSPSMTITLGTSSIWNSRDSASCASLYNLIGKALNNPKSVQHTCTALLCCLERIVEYIVSVKIVKGRRRHRSCLSLVLYLFVKLGWIIRLIPL